MSVLKLQQVSKQYHAGADKVLDQLNFELGRGEVCAFVGESGTGKSTLLKLIAGLESCDAGKLMIEGQIADGAGVFISPEKRKTGFLFQEFALFPHITVAKNIGYGLTKKERKGQRVNQMLELVGLPKYGQRFPHELSGGEQQRVALARALAPGPSVLLLDEPFCSLDELLKAKLRAEMFRIIRSTGVSVIMVKHDIKDASAEADQIAVMHQSKIIQKATPQKLYHQPVNMRVARLFGEVNTLTDEDMALFQIETAHRGTIGVRAESITYSPQAKQGMVKAKITQQHFLGGQQALTVQLPNGHHLLLSVFSAGKVLEGDLFLEIHKEHLLLL